MVNRQISRCKICWNYLRSGKFSLKLFIASFMLIMRSDKFRGILIVRMIKTNKILQNWQNWRLFAELTGILRAHEVRLKSKQGLFYYLTPTKDPRLVTFHRKVKLQKLCFYLVLVVKLALGFIEFFAIESGRGSSLKLELAF